VKGELGKDMENLKIKSPDGSSGNKNSLSQRKKCS
jgi:hypothetical protein